MNLPIFLSAVGRSAKVVRYHTENTLHKQTVGEHTYGVLWFVYLLTDFRPSPQLVLAALAHDMAEQRTGDMPADTKLRPDLKAAMTSFEDEVDSDLGLPKTVLTSDESVTLKLADTFEGALFCMYELESGNRRILAPLDKYMGWVAAYVENNRAPSLLTAKVSELYSAYKETYNALI